jgi:hypothetical protein
MHILFGVWIPNQGWLKVNGAHVAFEYAIVAQATADRVGNGARVEYIDDSLAALEPYLLSLEKQRNDARITIKIYNVLIKRFGGIQAMIRMKT